jgi:hypothetical protein
MILCGTVSLAGTIDPNTPDSKYVEYGSKFNFIHKICGTYQDNGLYCASCVIIDKNWAITAAHVVKGAQLCFISQADKVYAVDKIIYHELYKEDQYGYHDIALCHSSSDIKLDFYPELYTEKDEINKICCISGYGLTGTFLTGIKTGDDKRRAGSNKIEYIDRHLLICTPSKTNRTELEFLIGSGDSGGGLFIDGKLAGINSCVLSDDGKPDSTYTDESGHTRVSLYNEWIKSNIKSYTQEILAQSDEKKK